MEARQEKWRGGGSEVQHMQREGGEQEGTPPRTQNPSIPGAWTVWWGNGTAGAVR